MMNSESLPNNSLDNDDDYIDMEQSNFGLDTLPLDVVEQMYEVVKHEDTRFVRALKRQIAERKNEA